MNPWIDPQVTHCHSRPYVQRNGPSAPWSSLPAWNTIFHVAA